MTSRVEKDIAPEGGFRDRATRDSSQRPTAMRPVM